MSSYLRVLRHRDFRRLFLGQSASGIGDQVVIVALALYITQRTGSATDLGLVLAAQSLALVTLLVFGGVWADRRGGSGRHRVMIAADLVRAALHLILAALILAGGATVAEMVVIEALFGAARAFFQPAYTGLIPQTIAEDLIQDAQALTATVEPMSALVGPALGAGLVLGVGAGPAFALDAATFALSAALLARVRPRRRGSPAAPSSGRALDDLRAGWREVSSRPWVWVTVAAFAGAVLCGYATWYALAPLICRHVYGSSAVFGVLESLTGGGAVLGAVVAIRWRPVHPLRTGLAMILMWPASSLVFALGAPLPLVAGAVFAAGFSFAGFGIAWETALARHVPPHALSRVSAYDWMGSLALLPLGFALAGPLAGAVGPRVVLAAGSAVTFVLLGAALLPRSTRMLRDQPEPEPEPEPDRAEPRQPSSERAMSL
jgi:MFS family permease